MAPNYEGLRRMQDYHRRFTATEYTSTQLGQMDASCGNCRRRDGLICLIKAKQNCISKMSETPLFIIN